jgi:hypothetical protein
MKTFPYIILLIFAACAAPSGLQAHISYNGRNFGALVLGAGTTITNQTVSGGFGWADATDGDWGDSHRGRFFRFNLSAPLTADQWLRITVERNNLGTGAANTFLPGFSLFSGLAQRANNEGVQQGSAFRTEALAHDNAVLSTNSRPAGTEGSFRALADWSIGNDPTYVTAADPTSGILIAARLASFGYIGHAADGTDGNFGLAPNINGDVLADGFVTSTFTGLAAGDYSLFVGGANYNLQTSETGPPGPPYPTYGVNVTVGLVPEPSTWALLVFGGLAAGWTLRKKLRR